jgi:hypothetical protein
MTLEEERKTLEEQKRELELERREFARRIEFEDKRLEQQQQLFDIKLKILEEELIKLATEKQRIERQKEFYQRVGEFEYRSNYSQQGKSNGNVVEGELFFSGVRSKQSLKKRYKDLLKIYHPDNQDGDHDTIQEIIREYDHLSKMFV